MKFITCDICGRQVKKGKSYRCLKCSRAYGSDCIIDLITIVPTVKTISNRNPDNINLYWGNMTSRGTNVK